MKYEGAFIAIFKNEIVILYRRILGSIVETENGNTHLTCEWGPISEFQIIGEI